MAEIRLNGLPHRTYPGPKSALQDARGGSYEWWWRYARLSPIFWYARESGRRPINPRIDEVYQWMGSTQEADFGSWWMSGGYELFSETVERPRVRIAGLDESRSKASKKQSLLVEVPLTISRHDIHAQFKKLLAAHHAGRGLKPTNQGKALLCLAKVNFRQHALENQYWALVYKLLYPKIITARIGDRLQFAPQHNIRDHRGEHQKYRYYSRWDQDTGPFHHLMAITTRYLSKAKNALGHLQHGTFPCYDRYVEAEPFGSRWHAEYKSMTACEEGIRSPYQDWLRRTLHRKLKNEVIERNRFREILSRDDLAFQARFQSFFEGKTDRTA